MAFRNNNAATILDTLRQFVSNRGNMYHDPMRHGFSVECAKHPGVDIPVNLLRDNNDIDILDAIHNAFDSCVGCLLDAHNKQQWANTKFPEGAEL